jgi:radical SAM protein with 4Fe4S-binding SPASM domain
MIIECSKNKYEVFFEMIQFEITGKCNMKCDHCRAWKEPKGHMKMEVIEKILDFAVPESRHEIRFTISGGEPLLHPHFFDILKLIKKKINQYGKRLDHAVITTNGSLLTSEIIKKIEELDLGEIFLQVSIDSFEAKVHDKFRHFPGAFHKAKKALEMVAKSKLTPLLRTTIVSKDATNDFRILEEMIKMAQETGVGKISFGPVIPTGKAQMNQDMMLKPLEKKAFIEKLLVLKRKYPSIGISTEDPVKFSICPKEWDFGEFDYSKSDFIGGCSAGVTNMNVFSNGIITPCSMLQEPIVNVIGKSSSQIRKEYISSDVIKNLVERNVGGKCKTCKIKRLCGGCRAAAEGISGNYLAEDPTCWMVKNNK